MIKDTVQAYSLGSRVKYLRVTSSEGLEFCFLEDVQDAFGLETRCQFEVEGVTVNYLRDANYLRFEPKRLPVFSGKVIEILDGFRERPSSSAPSSASTSSELVEVLANHSPASSIKANRITALATAYASASHSQATLEEVESLNNEPNVPPKTDELAEGADDTQESSQRMIAQYVGNTTVNSKNNFKQFVVKNISDLVKLSAGMDGKMDVLEQLARMTVKLQQETNDRLVLIQRKAEAILVQNFELLEYTVPRLFIILPEPSSPWDKLTLSKNKFRLHFICECGDHTMSSTTKLPHHLHLARHEGYEIRQPYEFFRKYGSFLLFMLELLKFGANVTGLVVPVLASLRVEEVLGDLGNRIRDTARLTVESVDRSISFLESLRDNMDAQYSPDDIKDERVSTSQAMRDAQGLEGVDLRQLRSYLQESQGDNLLGNLYRMTTLEGHVKWVCQDHYRSGYQEARLQELRDLLRACGGSFEEQLGRVVVNVTSSLTATELYASILRARGVFELDLKMSWSQSLDDLKKLKHMIVSSGIVSLTLSLQDFKLPAMDLNIRGKRQYDPVFDMMRSKSIQKMHLRAVAKDIFERCSEFARFGPINLKYLQLDMTLRTKKDLNRLKSLLLKSTSLQHLGLRATQDIIAKLFNSCLCYILPIGPGLNVIFEFRDPDCDALDNLWLRMSVPRTNAMVPRLDVDDIRDVLVTYKAHIGILWLQSLSVDVVTALTSSQHPWSTLTELTVKQQFQQVQTTIAALISRCPTLQRLKIGLEPEDVIFVVNAAFQMMRGRSGTLELVINGIETERDAGSDLAKPETLLLANFVDGGLVALVLPNLSILDVDIRIGCGDASTVQRVVDTRRSITYEACVLSMLCLYAQDISSLKLSTMDAAKVIKMIAESRVPEHPSLSVDVCDRETSISVTWNGGMVVSLDCPDWFVPTAEANSLFSQSLCLIRMDRTSEEFRVVMRAYRRAEPLTELEFPNHRLKADAVQSILNRASTITCIRVCSNRDSISRIFTAVVGSRSSSASPMTAKFYSPDKKYNITASWSKNEMTSLDLLSWYSGDPFTLLQGRELSTHFLQIYRLEPSIGADTNPALLEGNRTRANIKSLLMLNPNFTTDTLYIFLSRCQSLRNIDITLTADKTLMVLQVISRTRTENESVDAPVLQLCLREYQSNQTQLRVKWVKDQMTLLDAGYWKDVDLYNILRTDKFKEYLEILTLPQLTWNVCACLMKGMGSVNLKELTVTERYQTFDGLRMLLSNSTSICTLNLTIDPEDFIILLDSILGISGSILTLSVAMVPSQRTIRLIVRQGQLVMLDCVGWTGGQGCLNNALSKHGSGLEVVWLDNMHQLGFRYLLTSTCLATSLKELSIRQQSLDLDTCTGILQQAPKLSYLEVIIPSLRVVDLVRFMKTSWKKNGTFSSLEVHIKDSSADHSIRTTWHGDRLVHLACSQDDITHIVSFLTVSCDLVHSLEGLEIRTPIVDIRMFQDFLKNLPRLHRVKVISDYGNVPLLFHAISRTLTRGKPVLEGTIQNVYETARIEATWSNGHLTRLDYADWPHNDLAHIINAHGAGLQILRLDGLDDSALEAIVGTTKKLIELAVVEPKFDIPKLDQILAANTSLSTVQFSVDEDDCLAVLNAILKLRQRTTRLEVMFWHPVLQDSLWFQMTLPTYANDTHQCTMPRFRFEQGLKYISFNQIFRDAGQLITRCRRLQSIIDTSDFTTYSAIQISDSAIAAPTASPTDHILTCCGLVDLQVDIHSENQGSILKSINWHCLETLQLSDDSISPEHGLCFVHDGLQKSISGAVLQELTYNTLYHNTESSCLLNSIVQLQPLQRIKIWARMDVTMIMHMFSSINFRRLRFLSVNAVRLAVYDVQRVLDSLPENSTLETLELRGAHIHHIDIVRMKSRGIQLSAGYLTGPVAVTLQ
ncbi:hypothetical protein BGX28_010208 [Mortierella sp. GBA30]|nr:hypothetical protein BGX28_010208 [Mortierella sp. GBA30]